MQSQKIYPSNLPSWYSVLSGLRSGEYHQGDGAMCQMVSSDKFEYCPLGIMALLAGAKFELHGPDATACDQDGETTVPPRELLEHLNLTEEADVKELHGTSYYDSIKYFHGEKMERWNVITYLNDFVGYTLGEIADELERLGWTS